MTPATHPSNTRTLGAPKDWDHSKGACSALPITDSTLCGIPCAVSFWRPSPAELELLNTGGSVSLWVTGQNMPPVAVEVEPAGYTQT